MSLRSSPLSPPQDWEKLVKELILGIWEVSVRDEGIKYKDVTEPPEAQITWSQS